MIGKNSGRRADDRTRAIVLTGLLCATALVLAVIEGMLPPVPAPVPGVKFGLSNIVVMFALFVVNGRQAYLIAVVKAFFVLATRGVVAGLLSLAGGLLSVSVMLMLLLIFRERVSYLVLSIFGAIFHNIGQFFVITVLYAGMNMLPYLPVLLVAGVGAGVITASLLRVLLPALRRIGPQ